MNEEIQEEQNKSKLKLVKINSDFFPNRYSKYTNFQSTYGVVGIFETSAQKQEFIEKNKEKYKTGVNLENESNVLLFLDPRYYEQARVENVDFISIQALPMKDMILDPWEWTIEEYKRWEFENVDFIEEEKQSEVEADLDSDDLECYKNWVAKKAQETQTDFKYLIPSAINSSKVKIITKDGVQIQDCVSDSNLYGVSFDPTMVHVYFKNFLNQEDESLKVEDIVRISDGILKPEKQADYEKFIKKDSIAWMAWWKFVEENYAQLSEIDASEKLLSAKRNVFLNDFRPSFENIVCNNAASAKIHGRPSENILVDGIILVDAGSCVGKFISDVSRVLLVGPIDKISNKIKEAYTKTLQAYIAIANAEFTTETQISYLDEIARRYVNFAHATGHAVGAKDVHAYPSVRGDSSQKFIENTLFALEPAIYFDSNLDDESEVFGIRLESQFLVQRKEEQESVDQIDQASRLYLKQLTFLPFEYDLILQELLTAEEKLWLSNFHKICYEELVGYVDLEFLKKKTSQFIN